ncbi:MAG: hypothetical protein KDA85_16900, partial [Planctomycetaceae bacterium]|nr:hypothetical protein [Planctomycetaceae bacterium]
MIVVRQYSGFLLAVLLTVNLSTTALAHPEGFSGIQILIREDHIECALTLHTRDLDAWFPPGTYADYVNDVCRELEHTIDEVVELRLEDEILPVQTVMAQQLETGLIETRVTWQLPPQDASAELLVWSKHLYLMPRGHQQILTIEDRRGVRDEQPGVLSLDDILTVERDAAGTRLRLLEVEAAASQMVAPVPQNRSQERAIEPTSPDFPATKPVANLRDEHTWM